MGCVRLTRRYYRSYMRIVRLCGTCTCGERAYFSLFLSLLAYAFIFVWSLCEVMEKGRVYKRKDERGTLHRRCVPGYANATPTTAFVVAVIVADIEVNRSRSISRPANCRFSIRSGARSKRRSLREATRSNARLKIRTGSVSAGLSQ